MATFPKALSRTGVSQVNLVQYRAVKPNLHRIRFGERISTMRTAGNAAPSAPQRQTTIGYDAVTGRIATMLANGSDIPFTWSYLPGSDLKSSLAYPNGLTASWTYDANGQLLQVRNAVVATAPSPSETEVISQYDYVYDNAGRRVSCAKSGSSFTQNDALSYGYNEKSELTNAVAAVDSDYRYAYDFDEIGNRESANERGTNAVYMANQLNQYTAVDDFTPQFDDDGNQTLVKTTTGVWSVAYNGENRPVLWTGGTQSAATNIVMSFDRMGRRVEYLETAGGSQSSATETNAYHRFLYDDYLCIQRLDAANGNAVDLAFVWDVAEPIATRPLIMDKPEVCKTCVTHDGNKNVAELISDNYQVLVHYDYSSFGDVAVSTNATSTLPVNLRTCNPFRFSSEYSDDVLGLSCYNYRHYDSRLGRWNNRDVLFNPGKDIALYCFVRNSPNNLTDLLGLRTCLKWEKSKIAIAAHGFDDENTFDGRAKRSSTKWYPASTGAEMFKVLESYSDRNGPCCKCIEKLHIHSHSSYDSVIMLWNSGFVADWVEYMKRNQEGSEERKKGARLLEGRDVNDLKRAMATGRIVFCDHCVITLFGCNTGKEGGLAHRISEVTDCLIVAPRGSASSANKEGNAVGTNGNRGPEVGGFCDRGWSVWEKGKHHDTKKKSPVFYNH